MVRTKSMVYDNCLASKQLFSYIVMESDLLKTAIPRAIKAIARKKCLGLYSDDLAVDTFYTVVTKGNNAYMKEYGRSYTVGVRFTVATDMLNYFRDDIDKEVAKLS